ncbi:MAG: hypothetical protein M1819_003136 [Sarea resinae]|nr:MAG: hypothetical protein M1819_003136 [Sarea resinae]
MVPFRPYSHLLHRANTDTRRSERTPFTSFPNVSTSRLALQPPDYDAATEAKTRRNSDTTFLEEGREQLPTYSCAIAAEGVLHLKTERHDPFNRADGRSWTKVFVVLRGTVLNIHHVRSARFFRGLRKIPEDSGEWIPGQLIKSYTLQYAEVGLANDYTKRPFCFRVRAETEQFLLGCSSMEATVVWLERLGSAIDLALPLDERRLPRYRTIPWRRSRRANTHHHHQAIGGAPSEYGQIDRALAEAYAQAVITPEVGALHSAPEQSVLIRSFSEGQSPAALDDPHALHYSFSAPTADPDEISPIRENEPSTPQKDKWHPKHNTSQARQLRYAHRCMPVLQFDSKRQSEIVVSNGQRFTIDPVGKKLDPYDPCPPTYEEGEPSDDMARPVALHPTSSAEVHPEEDTIEYAENPGPLRDSTGSGGGQERKRLGRLKSMFEGSGSGVLEDLSVMSLYVF